MNDIPKSNQLINTVLDKDPEFFLNLAYHLTSDEFKIYYFLSNVKDGFTPSMQWVADILGYKSRSTSQGIVDGLKTKGLIEIQKVGQVYIWLLKSGTLLRNVLLENVIVVDVEKEKKVKELKGLEEKIDQLEHSLELSYGDERERILNELIEAREQLRRK